MKRVGLPGARVGGGVRIALLLAPAFVVIGVLFIGGLYASFVQSLGYFPAIGQTTISLDAYRDVLASGDFLRSLSLTLYIAVVSTGISTVLAVVVFFFFFFFFLEWPGRTITAHVLLA